MPSFSSRCCITFLNQCKCWGKKADETNGEPGDYDESAKGESGTSDAQVSKNVPHPSDYNLLHPTMPLPRQKIFYRIRFTTL